LTSDQIAGWNSLAGSITLKDSLGNSYKPSGIDLYVGNNRNLSTVAETSVEDPPAASPSFDDITPLALTATAGTPTFHVVPTIGSAPTGFVFLVRATPQVSPGKSYFGPSAYRVVGPYAASTFASINILANYIARFGALIEGQRINVAVSLVEIASGFQSIETSQTVIVGA